MKSRQEVSCPICGESILAVAKKCKHCREWLQVSSEALTPQQKAPPMKSDEMPELRHEPRVCTFQIASDTPTALLKPFPLFSVNGEKLGEIRKGQKLSVLLISGPQKLRFGIPPFDLSVTVDVPAGGGQDYQLNWIGDYWEVINLTLESQNNHDEKVSSLPAHSTSSNSDSTAQRSVTHPPSKERLPDTLPHLFVSGMAGAVVGTAAAIETNGKAPVGNEVPGNRPKDFSQLSQVGLATIRDAKERIGIRCLGCGYSGEAGVVAGSHRRNWFHLIWIVPVSLVPAAAIMLVIWNVVGINGRDLQSKDDAAAFAIVFLVGWFLLASIIGYFLAFVSMPVSRMALCPACRQQIGPFSSY